MSFSLSRALLACAMLMPFSRAAHAAAPTATGSGLQVLFGMVVVLGLLMGVAWWLKRFGPVRGTGNSAAKIVGGVSVGTRERVMVVEVGDQWIVIGVAPGSVNALSTMPRQEHVPQDDMQMQSPSNFSGWLKQTIDRRNGKQ
ncbi:flagellar biosynthetic protein FliO [Oxalobacteraceae bacterium R-40]|uniref:Flagellar protein n=1 Tax=Keguizhuia sedimenti TaxID=3064264 RepID=A0ABU1BPF1_9BURK|nr:flagellar biosynthetic protein FliO [Oxalobacteraceae bacterium R-40]